jgi:hypothetical protein
MKLAGSNSIQTGHVKTMVERVVEVCCEVLTVNGLEDTQSTLAHVQRMLRSCGVYRRFEASSESWISKN